MIARTASQPRVFVYAASVQTRKVSCQNIFSAKGWSSFYCGCLPGRFDVVPGDRRSIDRTLSLTLMGWKSRANHLWEKIHSLHWSIGDSQGTWMYWRQKEELVLCWYPAQKEERRHIVKWPQVNSVDIYVRRCLRSHQKRLSGCVNSLVHSIGHLLALLGCQHCLSTKVEHHTNCKCRYHLGPYGKKYVKGRRAGRWIKSLLNLDMHNKDFPHSYVAHISNNYFCSSPLLKNWPPSLKRRPASSVVVSEQYGTATVTPLPSLESRPLWKNARMTCVLSLTQNRAWELRGPPTQNTITQEFAALEQLFHVST